MSQKRVLVVEDEPDGQAVVRGLLRHLDVYPDTVATAEEAMHMLNANHYDGVILDIALPGMDGLELLTEIRHSDLANLPCMIITAFHSSQVKQHALDAGCDVYFAKPLDKTSFMREFERMMLG